MPELDVAVDRDHPDVVTVYLLSDGEQLVCMSPEEAAQLGGALLATAAQLLVHRHCPHCGGQL
jgi:hypothetical protein